MYELKLRAWRICRGLRLKTLLYAMLFAAIGFCSFFCGLTGLFCLDEGADKILEAAFPNTGLAFGGFLGDVFTALLFFAFAFFLVCASCVAFALKAAYCNGALSYSEKESWEEGWEYFGDSLPQKTADNKKPTDTVSLSDGVKYLVYGAMSFRKKLICFTKLALPFFLNLLTVCLFAVYFGFDANALILSFGVLLFLLVFALSCSYYRNRQYDIGSMLLCVCRELSPKQAIRLSERMSAKSTGRLCLCRLFLLPRRLACLLLPALPFNLAFCGVFFSLAVLPKNVENAVKMWYDKDGITEYGKNR